MNGEARKLHLIEALLKIEDEVTLSSLAKILHTEEPTSAGTNTFKDFAGIWTAEEADKCMKAIHEGVDCGHPDSFYKNLHCFSVPLYLLRLNCTTHEKTFFALSFGIF